MVKCENHDDRVAQMKTKVAKVDAIKEQMKIVELEMGRASNKYPPKLGPMIRGAERNIMVHAKISGVYNADDKPVCNRVAHKFYGVLHPTDQADSKENFINSNNHDNTDSLGSTKSQYIFAVIDLGYYYKLSSCYVFSTCRNLKGVKVIPY